MYRVTLTFACVALLAVSSVFAISPSNDLLIAGAARTNRWQSDLFINNPGDTTVSVDVIWINRDPDDPNPNPATYNVGPDETLILVDVLNSVFGYNRAEGAFRITATGGVVTANLIVFTTRSEDGATYGSGFEAIPASSATTAGNSTNLTGLILNDDFYTNLFALAGANGATMDVDLLNADGDVLDTAQVVLNAYQPWFSSVEDLWDESSYDEGTAQAMVSAGSMVMLGSKVDRLSKDPTTLEQEFGAGGGSVDGTYWFATTDSEGFSAGGSLVIVDGNVDAIYGTYFNWDKGEQVGEDWVPDCTTLFLWGLGLPSGTPIADFAAGYEFSDVYNQGGTMDWTLTFTMDGSLGFSGTLDAEGSSFVDPQTGCNGEFPTLLFDGGKSN